MTSITVFGSIVLDMVTQVPRLPTPGETIITQSYQFAPGGKGANQALAAARAGATVRMIGAVGYDSFAELALVNLDRVAVDLSNVERQHDAPTGCANVAVDSAGNNQIVVAAGANFKVQASQLELEDLAPADIFLMQMELDLRETWAAAKRAKERHMQLVLNAAPFQRIPSDILDILDILIVNEVEASQLAETGGLSFDDYTDLACKIADAYQLTAVITLGGDGVVCADANKLYCLPALPVDVIDTVGAGDSFVGAFCAALAGKHDMRGCLNWGILAGSLACTALGAQTAAPRLEEMVPHLEAVPIDITDRLA